MDTSLPPGHKSSSSFPPDKATAAAALSVAKSLLHVKMGTSFYAQDGAAEKDAGITLLQAVLKEQGMPLLSLSSSSSSSSPFCLPPSTNIPPRRGVPPRPRRLRCLPG